MRVPVLIISGSMGAGKTTVMSEASDLLAAANVAHAAIDLDWLSIMHPNQDRYGERLMFANLAAVWPIYAAAGAQRLLVARVMERVAERDLYCKAVPGADILVCRLTASTGTMVERVRGREPGTFQSQFIARSVELAGILEQAQVEDFTVDNERGCSVTDVAREVLSRAGWIE